LTGTASRTLSVGLDASTATAGLKSGTVTIANLDVTTEGGAGRGANDADDVITTSLAVLTPAIPSFLAESTSSILTLDFGTLVHGASPGSLEFDIFNLAGALGSEWTAGLDLDGIVETDASGVFSQSISTFTNLAAGSSSSAMVSMSTALLGSFSGSLLLNFSDKDLPGATASSMTVQLQGVVVVPEPATIFLAAAGLMVLATSAWARRR
jgi:hypothetical protein